VFIVRGESPYDERMLPLTLDAAKRNVAQLLALAVEHTDESAAVVVWDAQCDLAIGLAQAYLHCLPNATSIEFDSVEREQVLSAFDRLKRGDLVVLIESTRFSLAKFRFRMELFKRSLKVIEHPHLARMTADECGKYVDSLAYDPDYFRGVGYALKERIDRACEAVIVGGPEQLIFSGELEAAKLNIGDYREMKNVGGQFPIGEVMTEAKKLSSLSGRALVSSYGDKSFQVRKLDAPMTLIIEEGLVAGVENATEEFEQVLADIKADEGKIWVREFGLGMNRAFSESETVTDMGTYERMCGVHLSLGAKHHMFPKAEIKKKDARHHVDVMLVSDSVQIDGEEVFRNGAWLVQADPGSY